MTKNTKSVSRKQNAYVQKRSQKFLESFDDKYAPYPDNPPNVRPIISDTKLPANCQRHSQSDLNSNCILGMCGPHHSS